MKERLDASGIGAVVAVGVRDSDLPPTIPWCYLEEWSMWSDTDERDIYELWYDWGEI